MCFDKDFYKQQLAKAIGDNSVHRFVVDSCLASRALPNAVPFWPSPEQGSRFISASPYFCEILFSLFKKKYFAVTALRQQENHQTSRM